MIRRAWRRYVHLPAADRLANRFHLLRHGRSEANARELVSSAPASALTRFGLTPAGAREVAATLRRRTSLRFAGSARDRIVIYTSPYRRARETAAIAARMLGTSPPIREDRLRERYLGELDLGSAACYPRVWREDARDPAHTRWGVESVLEVLDRATAVVRDLDRAHADREILLVTHCDVAMILTCGWRGVDPRYHFRKRRIRTGELRPLA